MTSKIECAFIVKTFGGDTGHSRYYADTPFVFFDIVHDYFTLMWRYRSGFMYITPKILVGGRQRLDYEKHLMGMVDRILIEMGTGGIVHTAEIQRSIIETILDSKQIAIRKHK